jgi:raffinose/stachyose/melibiose transport system permease protein
VRRTETGGSVAQAIEPPEVTARLRSPSERRSGGTRELRSWLLLAVPALFLIGLFYLVPLVSNLALAFTDWSGFKNGIHFIGLDNFADLADLDLLTRPIILTLIYAVVAMVAQNVFGLAFALALEDNNRINVFLRSVFFTPVLLSSIAVGFIWQGYLNPNGPANALLSRLTGADIHIAWLATPTFSIVVVALIDAWKWLGFSTLIFIAGLNAIPRELKDAARVDGTSRWQLFWNVKRPLIAPAFTFNIVIALIGSLSAFDVIMATTRGGPGTTTTVLNVLVWTQFTGGRYGFASATTMTVTLLIMTIAVPVILFLRRREVQA